MYKRQGSYSYWNSIEKGMTKVNTQNETMTNSIKMPRLLYGLWQSLWGLPIPLFVRKSAEIGKYQSVNIPRMPILINEVNYVIPAVGFPPSKAHILMT